MEFLGVREAFGTSGAMRKVRGQWKLPEDGQTATHVRRVSESGRGRWVLPGKGETATHLYEPGVVYEYVGRGKGTHKKSSPQSRRYVETDVGGTHIAVQGALVPEHEVGHGIMSFSLAEVNPNDPKQVAAAFGYAVAMQRATRPGVQAVIVGQADGDQPLKGGEEPKFHVHIVENMTLYADMEVAGKFVKAGSKLAGDVTDIHRMRDAQDDFLDVHGHEYGLGPQQLPPSSEHAIDKRDAVDRRMAAQGKLSDHEKLKQMWDEAEDDPRVKAVADMIPVLEEMGAQTNHRVTRTGVNAGRESLTVKLPHMRAFAGAKRLGSRYDVEDTVNKDTGEVLVLGLRSRLELKGGGSPRPKRPEPVKAGPPRPIEPPTPHEISTAAAVVAQLALAEEQIQELEPWLEDWANDEGLSVEGLLEDVAADLDRVEDRERLLANKRQWDAERARRDAAEVVEAAPEPTPSAHAPVAEATVSAHAPTAANDGREPEVPKPEYDEQAWVENPPVRPTESFVQAGQRGAPLDEVLAIGRAWDEWRAYERSDVHAVHQDEAEAAAEAAAELERQAADEALRAAEDAAVKAAVADQAAMPASASGSASTTAGFVSKFTGLEVRDPKHQDLVDAMAAFENRYQPVFADGGRVGEAAFPKGVGPRFIERHEKDGRFDPVVLEVLKKREDRKAENREWFNEAAAHAAAIEAIRVERESADPLNWYLAHDVRELHRKRRLADRRRDEQLARMAEGDFDPAPKKAGGGGSGSGSPNSPQGQREDPQPGG